jgi:hypothetical protein
MAGGTAVTAAGISASVAVSDVVFTFRAVVLGWMAALLG